MASFHFEVKSGKRGSAANHAAYIARQGWHRKREDLVSSGHGNMPEWTGDDPVNFWKAADKFERVNGATYREFVVALPTELDSNGHRKLVDELIGTLVGDKPFQFAVHAPRSSLEGRPNLHLHLMFSDRVQDGIERAPERTFSRYNPFQPERGGRKKDSGGRTRAQIKAEMIGRRQVAADVQNAALQASGSNARVDHRSLREQGLKRIAERHLGPVRIRNMSTKEKEMYVEARNGEG